MICAGFVRAGIISLQMQANIPSIRKKHCEVLPMKALGYTRPLAVGELHKELRQLDCPVPEPAAKEVLVQMKATCINIDDLHIAEGTFFGGLYPSRASEENPSIPGVDVAGTVLKTGSEVSGLKPGDDVLGILTPRPGRGTWAEYCCVESRFLVRKPAQYSFEEAASCAIGGKTAANAVVSAGLDPGAACVVIGASGGIGSIIVQLLKHQGVRVTGVCSDKNRALVASLGAETVVDYTRGPLDEQLADVRFDAVIDCIGGKDTERRAMRILHSGGRFVTLCGPEKYIGERNIGKAGVMGMLAYVGLRVLVTRLRGPRYVMAGIGTSLEPLERLVLRNTIKPPIDSFLPFEEDAVRQGIAYVGSHRAKGKVVITIVPEDETA